MRTRQVAACLGVGLCLVAAPAAAQIRAPGEAPSALTAEAGLWDISQRAEVAARARGDRNRDEALNTYVADLTCRVAADHCGDVRVYVMDRPIFNAMAAPNGYVEIWSGLMLRAETEDELAFVLGHEVGHFLEEHSFERLRHLKITSNVVMAVSMGAAAAGAYYQVDVGGLIDAVYLAGLSGYYGYNQKQESQSDAMGLDRLVAIGLNPAAGVNIWENQRAETAASSFARVRRSEGFGSAFRTHPLTRDRIEALAEQGQRLGPRETTREDRLKYRAIIRPHLAAWIEDEHRHRDHGRILHLLDRLARDGEDLGLINFHRGEVYRRRREEGDAARALAAYREALLHADVPARVWRELGSLELQQGNRTAARTAFEGYLATAGEADDRWIIEEQLKTLNGGSDDQGVS